MGMITDHKSYVFIRDGDKITLITRKYVLKNFRNLPDLNYITTNEALYTEYRKDEEKVSIEHHPLAPFIFCRFQLDGKAFNLVWNGKPMRDYVIELPVHYDVAHVEASGSSFVRSDEAVIAECTLLEDVLLVMGNSTLRVNEKYLNQFFNMAFSTGSVHWFYWLESVLRRFDRVEAPAYTHVPDDAMLYTLGYTPDRGIMKISVPPSGDEVIVENNDERERFVR